MGNDLAPGDVVHRDFEVHALVGRGAFSTVYRAAQRSRKDRPVALKILHSGIQQQLEARAGHVKNPYHKEQLLCHRLRDPAICRIVKVGTTDAGRYFSATEWAPGVTIDRFLSLQKGRPVDVVLVAAVIEQVARALAEMHQHRVVHRDIKPSNLMIDGVGEAVRVRILDFGIAKLLGENDTVQSADDFLVGTPAYMAPEQAAGRMTDARTDIYGLASVAYELLSGKRPIQLEVRGVRSPDDYVAYLLGKAPIPTVPIAELRPELPPEVAQHLNRSLARDWNARPRDVLGLSGIVVDGLRAAAPAPERALTRLWTTLKSLAGRRSP